MSHNWLQKPNWDGKGIACDGLPFVDMVYPALDVSHNYPVWNEKYTVNILMCLQLHTFQGCFCH